MVPPRAVAKPNQHYRKDKAGEGDVYWKLDDIYDPWFHENADGTNAAWKQSRPHIFREEAKLLEATPSINVASTMYICMCFAMQGHKTMWLHLCMILAARLITQIPFSMLCRQPESYVLRSA